MSFVFKLLAVIRLLDAVTVITLLVGGALLIAWVTVYSGPAALAQSAPRRNKMPFYMPFLLIIEWLIILGLTTQFIDFCLQDSELWILEGVNYLAIAVVELVMIFFFIKFAGSNFSRRLKGFGLDLRSVGGDFLIAIVNFISVYPLFLITLMATVYICQQLMGSDFQMQQNQGLIVILQHPQIALRVLMIIFVIVIAPIFEEFLFRGLLQSTIRNVVISPWPAIVITSVIFTIMHPWMHWPALFVLSCCMGYAYERGGSLFRPVFIHAFFNAANVTAALLIG